MLDAPPIKSPPEFDELCLEPSLEPFKLLSLEYCLRSNAAVECSAVPDEPEDLFCSGRLEPYDCEPWPSYPTEE